MRIEKYTIAIFLGIAGIMFYAISGVVDGFHSLFRLFVFLIGLWTLHYGYKLIEVKYSGKIGQKMMWTVAFLGMLILLIAFSINHLYNPVIANGAGLLLDFILVVNIPNIANFYR